MVQLGVKYLPTIIGLFNSLTGGEGGPGIGGSGGGGAGGLLDLAANFLGGVTGGHREWFLGLTLNCPGPNIDLILATVPTSCLRCRFDDLAK